MGQTHMWAGVWSELTDDSDVVLGGLELPESDIDGDTALTLGLQFVENPGILEGALAELSGFLLGLLAGCFIGNKREVGGVACDWRGTGLKLLWRGKKVQAGQKLGRPSPARKIDAATKNKMAAKKLMAGAG